MNTTIKIPLKNFIDCALTELVRKEYINPKHLDKKIPVRFIKSSNIDADRTTAELPDYVEIELNLT